MAKSQRAHHRECKTATQGGRHKQDCGAWAVNAPRRQGRLPSLFAIDLRKLPSRLRSGSRDLIPREASERHTATLSLNRSITLGVDPGEGRGQV